MKAAMSGLETVLCTFSCSPVIPCAIIIYGKAQGHLAQCFILDCKLKAHESSLKIYLGLAQSCNLKFVHKSGFQHLLKILPSGTSHTAAGDQSKVEELVLNGQGSHASLPGPCRCLNFHCPCPSLM